MSHANAGHDLSYLWHGGEKVEELRARGMTLGLMPEMSFEENGTRRVRMARA